MPELPEVETVVRDLRKKIVGKKIKKVEIFCNKIVKNQNKKFVDFLVGQKIKNIERRGKLIIISFARPGLATVKNARVTLAPMFLTVHFRMTGQLIFKDREKIVAGGHNQKGMLENLPNKYSHVVFTFSDNSQLFYNDIRQFGYLELVDEKKLEQILAQFGSEPLGENFTWLELQRLRSSTSNKNIKAFLLDQHKIAGIGNIYADEVLWASKVLSQRKVGDLSDKELKKIWQNIKKILQKAIKNRGTTFNNYRDADGKKGGFKKMLKVYQRQNKKCLRTKCSGIIQKTRVAGRGTHFCPVCQK